MLFIDVDYFKSYNDIHGHRAGDDCIALVGKAVDRSLQRPADLAARYGGDEFVVLLPDTYADGALDVARRVLAAVGELNIPHGGSRVRAGHFEHRCRDTGARAEPHPPGSSGARRSRTYAAKQAGRNRVVATPTLSSDQAVAG